MPSDVSVFFAAYRKTFEFVDSFPHIESHANVLDALRDRFNLVLYVKRLTAPFKDQVQAESANSDLVWAQPGTDRLHSLNVCDVVLRGITHIFSDGHFLPVVADELWIFALWLLEKQTEWITNCAAYVPFLRFYFVNLGQSRQKWLMK